MKLSYTLTAHDLQACARYWLAQRATHHKKRYTVLPVALVLAAGLTMLVFPTGLVQISLSEVLVSIMPPLVIFAVICLIGNFLHRRAVAETFHGQSHVRLEEDGIHHGDENTEAKTRWEALRRYVETPEHIFLVYGYQQAIIIPKKQIEDSDQQAAQCGWPPPPSS